MNHEAMDVTRAAANEPDGTDARHWRAPTETTIQPDDQVPHEARQVTPEVGQDLYGSGRLLGNRYRLVRPLGQGGMGTVWKAHDTVIDRDVAVKEPHLPEFVADEDRTVAFARVEREARAAAQIDHPSVVTIHDVVSENGQPWIVMELINGQSLADVLTGGTLTPASAARIALAVVGALAAAHAGKVLHRDVKPSNVMLGPRNRIVLTDFGIAHIEGESTLTRTGTLVGSADYTAPERILGRVPGPESDLFALGVLLYTAIEGFSPFWRQTRHATLQAVLRAEPQNPLQAGELSDLIMQLLNKEPSARPTTTEITSVLERVTDAGAQPIQNRQAKGRTLTGTRRIKWTHPAVTALTAAVVAGSLVAAMMWPGGIGADAPWQPSSAAADDIPAGWKVEHKLGAAIAVPGDYEAYDLLDQGGGVAFQVEQGQTHQQLLLFRWDGPAGSPEERAGYWYRQYMESKILTEQEVVLSEVKVNGRKGVVLTMTFRGDVGQLWRKRELFYNTDRQPWKIVVDWAIDSAQNTGGDELFDGAVRTFKTG